MFSEVLDSLLAVVFPSHGDHSTLFPSAFSCLFVGVSLLSMSEGRVSLVFSFLQVPHEWMSESSFLLSYFLGFVHGGT